MIRAHRLLALLLWMVMLIWVSGTAWASAVDPGDAFLEVVVEPLAQSPYEQEMVLITVRGFYRASITRATLEQPRSDGFGWMQLGKDRWIDTTVGGRQGRRYERTIAVFPQRSGTVEIGAFVHRLIILARDGTRFTHEVRTAPTRIEVRSKPPGDGWWLPARGIRVTDSWDQSPERLAYGRTARRTVTLEVEGVGPELLPPISSMRAPGVISFADPEERTTELTPEGPISRVTWRWTVRPLSDAIGTLEAVTIPWFDSTARESREIVLAPQRVALAATTALTSGATSSGASAPGTPGAELAANAGLIGLLAGFLCGLLLLVPGLRIKSRAELLRLARRLVPDPEIRTLRRAARLGDARAVRLGTHRLLRSDRTGGPPTDGALAALLAPLDRLLYAPSPTSSRIDLRKLVRDFLAARGSFQARVER